ncbi:hypothetical protein ACRXCV_01735 [Halobacteriovorax sp. GFR7]|uniref:hypothetical protein n=1 Tax=unclassified Halobacteriovorax TaxID=2639665 RepID=UPI003723DD3E
MNDLEILKGQINQIMETNKPNVVFDSKHDRLIRDCEKELTSAGLKQKVSYTIDALMPEKRDSKFGGGQFSRWQYELSWQDWEGNFRLVLRNIPHNNSKLLIKLPEDFKVDTAELLESFKSNILKTISL